MQMKRFIAIIVSVLAAVFLAGCAEENVNSDKDNNIGIVMDKTNQYMMIYILQCRRLDKEYEDKFHLILSDLCSQDLWNSRDCYDTCNYLMVPMHYAFKAGDDTAVKLLNDFFLSFTEKYNAGKTESFRHSHLDI